MSILAVAEKPSVAKEIARIIGEEHAVSRRGQSAYNLIFDIQSCLFKNARMKMSVTSVLGHMKDLEFPAEYKWKSGGPPPEALNRRYWIHDSRKYPSVAS